MDQVIVFSNRVPKPSVIGSKTAHYCVGTGSDPITPDMLSTVLQTAKAADYQGVMLDFESTKDFAADEDGNSVADIVKKMKAFLDDADSQNPKMIVSITTGGSGFTNQLCCSAVFGEAAGCDTTSKPRVAKCIKGMKEMFGLAYPLWVPQMYSGNMGNNADFSHADEFWGGFAGKVVPAVGSPQLANPPSHKFDIGAMWEVYTSPGGDSLPHSPGYKWLTENKVKISGLAAFPP